MRTGIHYKDRLIVCDNHSLELYRICPEKYHRQIQQGLTPVGVGWIPGEKLPPAPELLYGIAIHSALDVMFVEQDLEKATNVFLTKFQPVPEHKTRTPGRGTALLEEYYERWTQKDDTNIASVQCELRFVQPLISFQHSGHEWTIIYGGLIDKVVTDDNGAMYLMDHKTSGYITAHTIMSYNIDNQFAGYVYMARNKLGFTDVDTLVVDLLLMHPKNNSFHRSPLHYTNTQLDNWVGGIVTTCRKMLLDYETIEETWPQYGHRACMSYNKLCAYHELCDAPSAQLPSVLKTMYTEDFWEIRAEKDGE